MLTKAVFREGAPPYSFLENRYNAAGLAIVIKKWFF